MMSLPAEQRHPSSMALELRIANPPPSLLAKYTRKEKSFFYAYAEFVVRLLQDPEINDKLVRILTLENVKTPSSSVDIRIMVFPARSFRGQSDRMLHGSYNSTASQISVYPLRLPREWIRRNGFDLFTKSYSSLTDREKMLLNEVSLNAVATLLHEVFHVKLSQREMARHVEESVVRKMEQQYMRGWEETILAATQRSVSRPLRPISAFETV